MRNHEIDVGLFPLMNMRMNILNDPTLKRPDFAAALAKLAPVED